MIFMDLVTLKYPMPCGPGGWTTADQKGDVVECEIDEIGKIRNVVC